MKNILSAAVLVFVVLALFRINTKKVHAPELFGDGQMYTVRVGDKFVGYIDAWGGWVIYGRVGDCRIVQIAGEPIGDVSGKISCHMSGDDKFSGWIDFRGHKRKFCGAALDLELPAKCYGE